ncbi:MAG TPA: Bax inhibitor-1/YccA family protein [Candidatus Cryosericum sp.]|nr:Bax inhibitor-1/YccA family protein [Candidatus Cryosericum sp.]
MEYQGTVVRPEDSVRAFFNRVYGWMAGGLALTAFIAWFVGTNQAMQNLIFGNGFVVLLLIVAEFGLVIGLTRSISRISAQTAGILFMAYAAVNGLTLSSIFLAYTGADITLAFITSAGFFLAMSLIGSATHMDLSKVGNIAMFGLIGIIVVSLINMFVGSSGLNMLISVVGIIVFLALIAWDTQKLRMLALNLDPTGEHPLTMAGGNPQEEKAAVIGALSLYLDLINVFLFLLQLFGGRRRD